MFLPNSMWGLELVRRIPQEPVCGVREDGLDKERLSGDGGPDVCTLRVGGEEGDSC